jgi:hypothetical protein
LIVDLRNVTVISQEGENALWELMNEGAEFRCGGVLTKHVIQQLTRRRKSNSRESAQALNRPALDGQGQ